MSLTLRLHEAVEAVCPIFGVSVGDPDNKTTWRFAPKPEATVAQRNAAQSAIDSFDNSPAAQSSWELQRLRSQRQAALDRQQDELTALIRAVVLATLDEINIIRAALVHPINGITRSGTTATATTPAAHGLSVGDTVAVHGADQAAYNGVKTVASVPTSTTFTFAVAGSPTTPATGSMLYAMGAVPATPPRTPVQVRNAVKAKLAAGDADE